MYKTYDYASILAPYIKGLIEEKRSLGFSYQTEAYILKLFDDYWIEKGYAVASITRESLEDWMVQRKTEGRHYRDQRVSFVRQLSLYMCSLGIDSYSPKGFVRSVNAVQHIYSDDEICELFKVIDSYKSQNSDPSLQRLSVQYKILFRLILCCGLRISEACCLRIQDVDFEKGILTINHSKGDRNRLVYIPDDLLSPCHEYYVWTKTMLAFEPYWLFPAKNPDSHISNTSVEARFNKFLKATSFMDDCDKKPTIHGLRHTFVVKRLNKWMEQGISLDAMMPYLSKYLGHNGSIDTLYYYHHVADAFRIVREKDTVANDVIPEVTI
ncbi:MAG: tyrosine-type recombinase/integrase [Clostridia bacterium]|nr:tyrosine-type recombinase/integrase [Clostridia bacterium]